MGKVDAVPELWHFDRNERLAARFGKLITKD